MIRTALLIFSFFVTVVACTSDSFNENSSFTKIYDTQSSDASFHPIDLVETDSGYLVLSARDLENSAFLGVQLIQLDKLGDYVAEAQLAGEHVIPVGEFMTVGEMHYFFTMNPTSNVAQLVSMGSNPSSATAVTVSNGIQFPLAANSTTNGELLLLSYDPTNAQTVLARIGTDGSLIQGAGYTIGAGNDAAEVQEDILEHYTDPERSALPFFCGELASNTYYFNGIYNFSLSLVFTDFSSTPSGVVQGQRTNGGFTQILPITTSTFSVFGYQFNDNFILPNLTLNTSAVSSSVDYMNDEVTITFSEFKSRTPAVIRRYTKGLNEYSIFAAETQSRQVGLYFYDTSDGQLAGIYNVGHIYPFTLGSIKVDSDNNLLVLGTTLVSGRFERLFFNKISAVELSSIIP